jgi:hypothetical protein
MIPTPSRRKKLASEPDFERPPLWIHEVVAGILAPRREAKRRAVLAILNRLPEDARPPSSRAKAARQSRS